MSAPCPFCGSDDTHVRETIGELLQVECKSCCATGPLGSSQEIVERHWAATYEATQTTSNARLQLVKGLVLTKANAIVEFARELQVLSKDGGPH